MLKKGRVAEKNEFRNLLHKRYVEVVGGQSIKLVAGWMGGRRATSCRDAIYIVYIYIQYYYYQPTIVWETYETIFRKYLPVNIYHDR